MRMGPTGTGAAGGNPQGNSNPRKGRRARADFGGSGRDDRVTPIARIRPRAGNHAAGIGADVTARDAAWTTEEETGVIGGRTSLGRNPDKSAQRKGIPEALEAVHAGFPSVAQDYFLSDFSFDEHVITHPETTFAVRVAGDSMRGAGIFDGDLLLVDRSLEPRTGDVVIAVVDDEFTVKRLEHDLHGNPVLHPENRDYPDITFRDGQELSLWGVVIGNYHYQRREIPRGTAVYGQD